MEYGIKNVVTGTGLTGKGIHTKDEYAKKKSK